MDARFFTLLPLLLIFCAGVSGQDSDTGGALIREEVPIKSSLGRTAIGLPEPTSNGVWAGTWMYISRDVKMALWLSEDQGKPIAKIRLESTLRATESFETDWSGKAQYFVQDYPGRFAFTINDVGPDMIEADWDWRLDMRGSSRTEEGLVEMYRAGDGRRLVMFFKEFKRTIDSGGAEKVHEFPQGWTFRKMSKRLVLWEELPL